MADKQQPNVPSEFMGDKASADKASAQAKDDSSKAFAKDAIESNEKANGKQAAYLPPMEGKLAPVSPEPVMPATAPQPTQNLRPGSIYDLVKQADQAPAPQGMQAEAYPLAPEVRQAQNEIPRTAGNLAEGGNWNSANFLNPLPMIAASEQALGRKDEAAAFQCLAQAQAAADLLTPANVRIILNDLEKLKRDLPQEMDSTKRLQMQERIALGTQILDSRWETPLRLSFAMLALGTTDGQPPVEAFRLLQQAAQIHPEIKDDPEVIKGLERISGRYGNMAQAVKQSLDQAVIAGAQTAGQTALERSEFQKDPALAQKLAEQGRLAQLESPDPYVHAQEAQTLMRSKGVLSDEARNEHDKAIRLAKQLENTRKESFNSVLAEIDSTKNAITGKQQTLAKLQEQINALKKESKTVTTEVAALCATRSEESRKSQSKNVFESAGSIFNQTLKSWNGEALKEEKALQARMSELSKKGNELRKLEAQRKSLEAEIKTSEGQLKDKQTKLSEIGKPIVEKHVTYAKALLQDAEVRAENTAKARGENNKDEFIKSRDLYLNDLITAAQQVNRAEKISPELSSNEEIKALKEKHQFVSTSVVENIKDLNAGLKQEIDDRFLTAVNQYNVLVLNDRLKPLAAQGKITEDQDKLIKELNSLKTHSSDIDTSKLNAAIRLISNGEPITEAGLATIATIESKSMKVDESGASGEKSMMQFVSLMGKRQYKDAEEAFTATVDNLKPFVADKHEKLKSKEAELNSCVALEQLPQLRLEKEKLEMEIAALEQAMLIGTGKLYLTSDKPSKEGEVPGPGYKPEQALTALNHLKEAFPGIENNPLYTQQFQGAQDLLKQSKELEIKARDDAEKAKEAGIDLATTGVAWAAGAGAGALVTAGLVAGAPVTVPLALTVLGVTALTGAVAGGLTKWGLANAADARDKDAVSNLSKGAFIGGTTGIGGGGLKLGGMALAGGIAWKGNTIYQGIKMADVTAKVAKVAPLKQSAEAILQGAKGNVAQEIQLGEKILETNLKTGKISQETYKMGKAWLAGEGKVGKAPINTAEVLESCGISLSEEAVTAAGLRLELAAGATGTKAIDAGWDAMKSGLPQAALGEYKWNVFGHAMNAGKMGYNQVQNIGRMASYAAPYNFARAASAGIPIGTASAIYNTDKYNTKVAKGEINDATGEAWTSEDALKRAAIDTGAGTLLALASMGALHQVSRSPLQTLDPTGITTLAEGAINKLGSKIASTQLGSKIGNMAPVAATRTFFTDSLRHDNLGFIAPMARNVVPLSALSAYGFAMAQDRSSKEANLLAKTQSNLSNYEVETASEEQVPKQVPAEQLTPTTEAPTQNTAETTPVANQDVTSMAPTQAAPQASENVANAKSDEEPQPSSEG